MGIAMAKYFLFPGQGSQIVSMGRDLAEKDEGANRRFDEACDILGFDIKKICFEGPEEKLRATENTQPALFLTGFAAFECFKRAGKMADYTAGHSLGEYTAIAAAGGFDFATGLRLVRRRGELMAKARAGKMAAVMGLAPDRLEAICRECCAGPEVVVPANFNAPDQTVISGSANAVIAAMSKIKEAGAKRVLELPVSGAFHSPLMEEAAQEMKDVLAEAQITDTTVPVISNVTAAPVTRAADFRELLVRQLLSPVRWVDSFAKAEPGTGVEMGPGRVLSGLIRRINRNIQVLPAHTRAEIDQAIVQLGA
jgi:[acyl-carrier-protein] S-malonyltransferase